MEKKKRNCVREEGNIYSYSFIFVEYSLRVLNEFLRKDFVGIFFKLEFEF